MRTNAKSVFNQIRLVFFLFQPFSQCPNKNSGSAFWFHWVIWSQTSCALCHTKNVLQSPLLKKWLQLEKYSICPAAGLCKRQQQERQIPPTEAIKLLLLLLCIFSQKSGFSSFVICQTNSTIELSKFNLVSCKSKQRCLGEGAQKISRKICHI